MCHLSFVMRAPWLLAIRERASDEFARPMTFDVLEFLTLVITGFTARALSLVRMLLFIR